jgi:hypothetical protein
MFTVPALKMDLAFAYLLKSSRLPVDESCLPPLLTPNWAPFVAALFSFGLVPEMPALLVPFLRDALLNWREETHRFFSKPCRDRVMTALMCMNRVAVLPSELRGIILRSAFSTSDEWFDGTDMSKSPVRNDLAFEGLRQRMLKRLFCDFIMSLQDNVSDSYFCSCGKIRKPKGRHFARVGTLLRFIISEGDLNNYDECVRLMQEMYNSVTSIGQNVNPADLVGVLQRILQ